MSRARSRAIVERSSPVTEYVTETREGMDNIADAIRTLAGVMASVAAGMHTDTLGNQRNMAGVIYTDAQERFSDVWRKMDEKSRVELEKWISGLCKGKR
jgi:hypothetical protein